MLYIWEFASLNPLHLFRPASHTHLHSSGNHQFTLCELFLLCDAVIYKSLCPLLAGSFRLCQWAIEGDNEAGEQEETLPLLIYLFYGVVNSAPSPPPHLFFSSCPHLSRLPTYTFNLRGKCGMKTVRPKREELFLWSLTIDK